MPRGTAKTDSERFDLKTLPGAFVVVRKLTYGEQLRVRGLSMRMHAEERKAREAVKRGEDYEVAMSVEAEAVEAYRFSRCIVDHNIDDGENILNFSNRAHFTALDPIVGAEIESYIDQMNPVEDLRSSEEKGGTSDTGKGPLATASTAPSAPDQ